MIKQLILFLLAPEIWGTVSDWVMILVTFATAILLLLTLKSQKEVQRTQNELFRIESIRFRESIKPVLRFELSKHQSHSGDGKKKIVTIEVSNETDSAAINISRFVAEDEITQQLFTVMGFDDTRDYLMKGGKPLYFHFGINSNPLGYHYLLLNFKYEDIANTKYQQSVICIYDERYGFEVHPSLPEIMTTVARKESVA